MLFVTALVPPLTLVGFDLISRRGTFLARTGPSFAGYLGGVGLGVALWALGLEAARHPRLWVRASAWGVLGLSAALGIGGQLLFRATTHEYFNREAAVFSIRLWPTIVHYLSLRPAAAVAILAGPAALAVGVAVLRSRLAGPRDTFPQVMAGLWIATWLFATFGPFDIPSSRRGLPPEVLFWHAAGGLGLSVAGFLPKPRALPPGDHQALPPPSRTVESDAPSIVLVFGESVRRDEVCATRSPDCVKSPRVDAAAPERIGFLRSFSVASCTEIASAVMWTGLPVHARTEAMQSAPLLWDYAAARGYRTAYFTSQNLGFGDQALFVRTSRIGAFREARDRDVHVDADIGTPDEVTVAEALDFLAQPGPAFVVVHLSNTHLPYRQVPGLTPHEAGDDEEYWQRRGRYLNSLVHHDATVADVVLGLRRTERGRRAIVVYSADHGEAWGEHQSFTHTFDLYAEQTDVPLWIDAPEGTLTPAQRRELARAAAGRPVFTPDVSATLIDLLGALDEPTFAPSVGRLAGASVLRPLPAPRDIEISNCPPYRSCYPEAWGLVRWPLKYHYVGRTGEHVCTDLEADPDERSPLPAASCEPLQTLMSRRRHDLLAPPGSPAEAAAVQGISGDSPPEGAR
jgi:arylsulfatase A-like enzyme